MSFERILAGVFLVMTGAIGIFFDTVVVGASRKTLNEERTTVTACEAKLRESQSCTVAEQQTLSSYKNLRQEFEVAKKDLLISGVMFIGGIAVFSRKKKNEAGV